MKYYIIVASLDHCYVSIKENIIQACHGKLAPMKLLNESDQIILYAHKQSLHTNIHVRRFIAIASVSAKPPYQYEMFDGFCPFRRNVVYNKNLREISIYDLNLSLTNVKHWGLIFRRGFFEINQSDYEIISLNMHQENVNN